MKQLINRILSWLPGRFDAYVDHVRREIFSDGSVLFLGALLQRSAERNPDGIALDYEDKKVTYKALYSQAAQVSQLLRKKGIKPHDRVLLFFENSIEFYVGYYAIIQLGAVVVPLNTFLKEAELTHIVNDAQPSLVITSSEMVSYFKQVQAVDGLPILTEQDMAFDTIADVASFAVHALDPDKMIALLYTSGTTGLPKGVMLSSRNCMTNVFQTVSFLHFYSHERVFAILPLFHSFAQSTCVWSAIFVGCTVILAPKVDRRSLLRGLKKKPSFFLGVPALYGLLCLLRTAPLKSVTYFVSGGDAMSDRIRSLFSLIYRRKICSGYGLTEAAPVVAVDLTDAALPTNNVGRPVRGMQVQIRDEEGHVLSQGAIGRMWIKGDNIMLGYYNEPEKTAEVLQDGWLDTGDLAYLDSRGRIVITGRLKDLIIHKGLNIYPQEIENVISGHAHVLRVGVIGKETVEGEVPIAYVQLRQGNPAVERELKDLCRQQLASYKVPREFIITTEDLPLTATGKVDKKVLRKQLHT